MSFVFPEGVSTSEEVDRVQQCTDTVCCTFHTRFHDTSVSPQPPSSHRILHLTSSNTRIPISPTRSSLQPLPLSRLKSKQTSKPHASSETKYCLHKIAASPSAPHPVPPGTLTTQQNVPCIACHATLPYIYITRLLSACWLDMGFDIEIDLRRDIDPTYREHVRQRRYGNSMVLEYFIRLVCTGMLPPDQVTCGHDTYT